MTVGWELDSVACRGIEIRGHAQALHATDPSSPTGRAVIRVHAAPIISWRLSEPDQSGDSGRAFPTGRGARPRHD